MGHLQVLKTIGKDTQSDQINEHDKKLFHQNHTFHGRSNLDACCLFTQDIAESTDVFATEDQGNLLDSLGLNRSRLGAPVRQSLKELTDDVKRGHAVKGAVQAAVGTGVT